MDHKIINVGKKYNSNAKRGPEFKIEHYFGFLVTGFLWENDSIYFEIMFDMKGERLPRHQALIGEGKRWQVKGKYKGIGEWENGRQM